MSSSSNRLADETSPYLQQHAGNPVHWQPWDGTALDAAREADKPILLSIGYSACHWCHVMAHESFEDEATAQLMNTLFVNVKVDREERPDLDRIYQLAHQMLLQRPGGWPLTMFLTPDTHTPFFGGTYFPPAPRHGLPGFREVLERVARYYREHGREIREQADAINEVFQRLESHEPVTGELDMSAASAARRDLEETFDAKWGGFGKAPRFPNAPALERLLRHWRASALHDKPDTQALLMAALTLRRMAEAGINDQLGGGFYRYAVDDYWMIPHFEKMLYDNAQLLAVYAQAAQATGEAIFSATARRTAAWMIQEMQAPEGGFYASLDADSEGTEGRYYVWDRGEIESLLSAQDLALFAQRFGLDRKPNFEGRWHLHVFADVESIAQSSGLDEETVRARLESARATLYAARAVRVRPGLDDKILSAWNGLAIDGLASAAVALQEPAFAQAATRAADFLRAHCWHSGRLLASWRNGRARFGAYLDDYAFLGQGLLRLLESRWRSEDLEFAMALADALLEHFQDRDNGGFFFTSDDHEELIHRPRPFTDDATPSGNAIAARFLDGLGHLLGEPRFIEAAERALAAAAGNMSRMPMGHCSFINALEDHLAPAETVIIRGTGDELERWRLASQALYSPARRVFAIPADATGLPGMLAERRALPSTVAYYCRGMTCLAPITELAALNQALAPLPGQGARPS